MDNTIQPDELEEARQPSGYTIAELCRDLQIIEHEDDRLAKHSVDSGTLYKDFSTQDPGETIQSDITQWVNDRGLSKR